MDFIRRSDLTNASTPDVLADGITIFTIGSDAKNFPENYSMGMVVKHSGPRVAQLFFGRSGTMYYRFGSDNTWINWRTLNPS